MLLFIIFLFFILLLLKLLAFSLLQAFLVPSNYFHYPNSSPSLLLLSDLPLISFLYSFLHFSFIILWLVNFIPLFS
jgi:hypothetical protein